ncbi:MAG: hypothetical protein JW894_05940 [Bacteroidales bacterium]|nr:hypothetical protein [Bacteroidales bacterium]
MKIHIQQKHVILLAVCLIALGFLFSCKNAAEKAAEKFIEKSIERSSGEEVDIDYDDEKVVIETEEGKIEVDAGTKKWPAGIPSEVPEFDYGKIVGVTTNATDEIKGWTIVYSEVVKDATEKYNETLQSKGFKTQTVGVSGMGGTITAEKDNIVIGVYAGDGDASVSVQVK